MSNNKQVTYGEKVSIRLPEKMDAYVISRAEKYGFITKSQAVRDIIRDQMIQEETTKERKVFRV